MKKTTLLSIFYSTVLATAVLISNPVLADNYQIDSAHSFLNFSIGHLGVSIAAGDSMISPVILRSTQNLQHNPVSTC